MIESIFHGHSCVEIRFWGRCILIDPFVRENPQAERNIDDVCALPLDAVIVTHGHHDHLWDTVEIAGRTGCEVISTGRLIDFLEQKHDLKKTCRVEKWEYRDKWRYQLLFTDAEHGGEIEGADPDRTCIPVGALVTVEQKHIYHAGDTALIPSLEALSKEHIDLAFLPIWGTYTMDANDALEAAHRIHSKYVVPIHYNTWPLIAADPMEFARKLMLEQYAVPKVLRPGQAVVL